jgi:monoamine oxidase
MAEELGDAVALNVPVRTIEQTGDHVTVASDLVRIRACWVIVAIPPPTGEALAARRTAVPQALAKVFGPQVLSPINYIEQDWTRERWSTG